MRTQDPHPSLLEAWTGSSFRPHRQIHQSIARWTFRAEYSRHHAIVANMNLACGVQARPIFDVRHERPYKLHRAAHASPISPHELAHRWRSPVSAYSLHDCPSQRRPLRATVPLHHLLCAVLEHRRSAGPPLRLQTPIDNIARRPHALDCVDRAARFGLAPRSSQSGGLSYWQ